MINYNALKMEFKGKALSVYKQTDEWCRGALTIIMGSIRSFIETNAGESAASISFYALFSFFPLLILLIGFVSSVLKNEPVQQVVLNTLEDFLPVARDIVRTNIEQVLQVSGTLKIAGTIGLLWSATGVFTAVGHSINRAWHTAAERNFVLGRLVALAMLASLTGLLILWVFFTTAFNLFPWFEIPLFGNLVVYETFAWSLLSRLIPWLVIFILFLNLYRWIPNTKVRWIEAIWGAGIAALGWEFANTAFKWYLIAAFDRYRLVYGSLGALVALMLWIYLGSMIMLFGAHLSANIALYTRLKQKE